MTKKHYKAFIRVVKTIDIETRGDNMEHFNIVRIPLMMAEDKKEVKAFLLSEYPQFFQKDKVYEKETKDKVQFFYVVIFELYQYEIDLIKEGEWTCSQCGHVHKNAYENRPIANKRLFGNDILFCNRDCMNEYKKTKFDGLQMFEDEDHYLKEESPNYIYKITEKSTGKCYIGKTKNEPFFRWWNHLSHSISPFGVYLSNTKLSEWTFEVIDILPAEVQDSKVFELESKRIIEYKAIENGFNSVISNKSRCLADIIKLGCDYYHPDKDSTAMNCTYCGMPKSSHGQYAL